MPLTRIDSAFVDLDNLGGITFDDQAGTPTFKVDAVNHRVGIGTASPSYKLQVEGDIKVGELGTLWFSDISNSIEKIVGGGSSLDLYADALVNFYESDADTLAFTIDNNSAKVYFEGDDNTYWHRPAADTHAFVNNGSTSLYINSGGDVGIGTESPSQKLHVIGNQRIEGDMDIFPENTGGEGAQITLRNPDKTTAGAAIDIQTANTFRIFQLNDNSVMELGQNAGTGGHIRFNTEGSNRMYIASDGNVGIGTISPTTRLEISEANGPELSLLNPGVRRWTIGLAGTNSNADLLIKDESGSKDVLYLARTTGHVGIGTSSPDRGLHIADPAAGGLRAQDTGGTDTYSDFYHNGSALYIDSRNNTGAGQILFRQWNGTAYSEAMRIDSASNVGINTTNPGSFLTIESGVEPDPADVGGNAKGSIYLQNVGGTPAQDALGNAIGFSRINTTRRGAMIASYQPTADGDQCGLAFYTRGSTNTASDAIAQRMVLDHSGAVGINTSTPENKLHIVNNAVTGAVYRANATLTLENNGATELYLVSSNTGSGQLRFGDTQGNYRGAVTYDHGNDEMLFVTDGNTRARIDVNGNFGIGTDDPQTKFVVSNSAGVGFEVNPGLSSSVTITAFDRGVANDWYDMRLRFNELIFSPLGGEKMRIDSSGNVGIGTGASSIQGPLHVQNNDNSPGGTIQVWGADTGTNLRNSRLLAPELDDPNEPFTFFTNNAWNFRVDTLDALTIRSNGNVGIGTTAPTELFEIAAPGDGNANGPTVSLMRESTSPASNDKIGSIHFDGRDSLGNRVLYKSVYGAIDVATSGSTTGGLFIGSDDTGAGQQVVVDGNGNVGIGASNPIRLLHLAGSGGASSVELRLEATDGGERQITFTGSGSNTHVIRSTGTTDNSLVFIQGVDERMRIDGSGNVGISASSPKRKLEIEGTGESLLLNLNSITDNDYASIVWQGSTTDIGTGDMSCEIRGYRAAAGAHGILAFHTRDTTNTSVERCRFDQNDQFLIGTTTRVQEASGTETGATFYGSLGVLVLSADNDRSLTLKRLNANGTVATFRRDNTLVGSISVTTTNTAFNDLSDYRLKENVVDLSDGISRVKQLKPSRFNFIVEPNQTVDGFLAHEVQAVVPEAITGEKDAVDEEGNPVMQQIDKSKLIPLLTAALQEALTKIETLEQRLTDAGL